MPSTRVRNRQASWKTQPEIASGRRADDHGRSLAAAEARTGRYAIRRPGTSSQDVMLIKAKYPRKTTAF